MTTDVSISTLVLTENFLPADGGSITWLLNTYSRLNPKRVIIVAPQCQGNYDVDKTLEFQMERIPMTWSDWDPTRPDSLCRYIQVTRHVHKCCGKYKVAQIHSAKVLPEGLVAWCIRRWDAIPYVVYAHGEEIQIAGTSRKLSWLLPKIYNGAATIIANSTNTKTLLEGIGVESEKIHIIHPGVDAASFRAADDTVQTIRRKHQLGESPVLLTVGRLQRRKGQDMVIKALPRIHAKFPHTKYVVVGTGEDDASLKQLAREIGVADSVTFAGRTLERELAAYYAACDVFIMPNRQIGPDIEGFGIVYLEANAAGKPVIGGTSGGTEDAILEGVTGLRVDGNNIEAIAGAVLSLLSDPEKAKAMGKAGQHRAEQEFAWEAVVQRTRSLASAIHPLRSKGVSELR